MELRRRVLDKWVPQSENDRASALGGPIRFGIAQRKLPVPRALTLLFQPVLFKPWLWLTCRGIVRCDQTSQIRTLGTGADDAPRD